MKFTSEWIAKQRKLLKYPLRSSKGHWVEIDDCLLIGCCDMDEETNSWNSAPYLTVEDAVDAETVKNCVLYYADALDHIEHLQKRIEELEQERRVYCTEDSIYPLKGDDVFFQLEDGKTHIGYYTENEGGVFISNNSSYAFWVEEEKIYWKLFSNLQEDYEQQADLPQPPKDGE